MSAKFDLHLKLFDELVDQCDRFQRKGKSVPYTSANGHMFSLLNKEGELGIRFGKEAQKSYQKELKTGDLMSHGATMRGYVHIPEDKMNETELLIKMLNESYDYVMSLDPK